MISGRGSDHRGCPSVPRVPYDTVLRVPVGRIEGRVPVSVTHSEAQGEMGVTGVAVGPVVLTPAGAVIRVHRNNGIILANVDAVVPRVTCVPVPLVIPAGILEVDIVQRIHGRVRCADSQTGAPGSEAHGNRRVAPGILCSRGARAPGGRESDQESRSHQFGHDVLLGRSCPRQLHRPCHRISTSGDLYLLRANGHKDLCGPRRPVLA